MKSIDFSMTYLALKMFGKQLYANISAAIAELVANGLDANAENVYVYMDIIEKNNATIAIFDDGDGMDSDSLEKEYAVIGRNKRKELKPEEAVKKMGRKGIGKLAALYLSDKYYIITKKENMPSPEFWELDVSNIVNNEQTPRLEQVEVLTDDVMFLKNLIDAKKGTIILLKNVKIKNFGDAAELALENKLANYFLTTKLSQKIKLCIRKKNNQKIKFKEVKKDIAHKNMAVIYTSSKKMFEKIEGGDVKIRDNNIPNQEKVFITKREIFNFPTIVDTIIKDGSGKRSKVESAINGEIEIEGVKYPYVLEGWIGVHSTIEQEDSKLNCKNFKKNMHYNPNQLRVYVRKKLATSDFLNSLGLTATFLNYIEGEIEFDVLDVEGLEDIATAGRDNFSVQDERVQKLVLLCKGIVNKLVNKRKSIADELGKYKQELAKKKEEEEREKIKERFRAGQIKSKPIFEHMPKSHQEAVEDDFVQFSRAANLSKPTKKILISHKGDCVEFGNFVIDVLLSVAPELKNSIIFTSNADFGIPQGRDICEYLKDCFREDIFVIFLFSKSYYDSNICLAEAGAAWGTNREYANFVIDLSFNDIADPINRNQKGAKLFAISEEDKKDMANELIRIIKAVGLDIKSEEVDVVGVINSTLHKYGMRLKPKAYLPHRKFQAVPICSNCNHPMQLALNDEGLVFICECGAQKIKAKIM